MGLVETLRQSFAWFVDGAREHEVPAGPPITGMEVNLRVMRGRGVSLEEAYEQAKRDRKALADSPPKRP